jgi:hypothetical protein
MLPPKVEYENDPEANPPQPEPAQATEYVVPGTNCTDSDELPLEEEYAHHAVPSEIAARMNPMTRTSVKTRRGRPPAESHLGRRRRGAVGGEAGTGDAV